MICPCIKCEKAGCGAFHDICPKYTEWKVQKDEANRRKAADQDARQLSRDHEMKYRKNLKGGFKNK